MAVSSSSNYNQTRNEIITDALVGLGVYRPGATISTNDINYCSNVLNKMVKGWQGKGIHLWTAVEGTLFLTNGINKYTITGSGNVAGNDVIDTTLSSTGSSGSSSLTVTSTTGMTAADNIGIELDNNTIQWTTIVSVDSSTTLTVTTPLTSAAASGNNIFVYTNNATKPIHVSSARFRTSDGTDWPVNILHRDEFMQIPNKSTTSSTVLQIMTEINRDQAVFYTWPTPNDVSGTIKYSYYRQIYDFDASSDNPDFPQEWLECLTLNLAVRVSKAYGKKSAEIQDLIAEAREALIDMQMWDVSNGSVRVVPNDYDNY